MVGGLLDFLDGKGIGSRELAIDIAEFLFLVGNRSELGAHLLETVGKSDEILDFNTHTVFD